MVAHSENEKRILAAYHRAKEVFSEQFGIPVKEMPTLVITQKVMQPHYDRMHNLIRISSQETRHGDSVGEELGHYVRDRLTNDMGNIMHPPSEKRNKEMTTHEFFGLLGRMVLYKGLALKEREALFEGCYPVYTVNNQRADVLRARAGQIVRRSLQKTKERLLGQLIGPYEKSYGESLAKKDATGADFWREKIKKSLPELAAVARESAINAHGGMEELQRLMNHRYDALVHSRGYKFAAQLETDKVDLRRLFSLPERDVRMRFFRPDPHYEVAAPAQAEPNARKKKLEEIVVIMLILAVSIPAFLAPSFTGYAIAQGASGIGVLLLGLILLVIFMIIKVL